MIKLFDNELADLGFQLQGVLSAPAGSKYGQLLVFGHGGHSLWQHVKIEGEDPIDQFSVSQLTRFMERINCADYEFLYPGDHLNLLDIGSQLGWYHISPMGIGINPQFGTWFAFRGVIAANTDYELSAKQTHDSPCVTCSDKPCVDACPVGAVQREGSFKLDRCITERTREGSGCAHQCLARNACPVGTEHQYTAEQIRYHYGRSLASIKADRGA